MVRCDPAPALRLWLTHVSQALPPLPPAHRAVRRERRLCAARLRGAAPSLFSQEDIFLGCFFHWTAMAADLKWWLSALQCVPQGLAVSGPALHQALGSRYGAAAPLWRSLCLHSRDGTQSA